MRLFAPVVMILMALAPLRAENWPHWRGPAATGVSTETGLPERWSDTENIAWKAPVRGLGISSPVVWGDQVFVTSQVGRSARRAGNHPTLVQGGNPSDAGERALGGGAAPVAGKVSFLVTALSRVDGRKLWEYELPAEGQLCRSARQAQSRVVEPRHRRAARLRVVRHRPDRVARHDRQARLVAASRPRVRAVRHQLGPQQLPRDLQRLADPDLLSRHRLVSAESRCGVRQNEMARRSRRQLQLLQHASGRAVRRRA